MSRAIALLLLLSTAAFGYAIGSHLASESRALIAGIMIGMLSSIPAAFVAAMAASRASREQARPAAAPTPSRMAPAPPPVLIVNPGQGSRSQRYAPYIDALQEPQQPRSFTVIDDDQS